MPHAPTVAAGTGRDNNTLAGTSRSQPKPCMYGESWRAQATTSPTTGTCRNRMPLFTAPRSSFSRRLNVASADITPSDATTLRRRRSPYLPLQHLRLELQLRLVQHRVRVQVLRTHSQAAQPTPRTHPAGATTAGATSPGACAHVAAHRGPAIRTAAPPSAPLPPNDALAAASGSAGRSVLALSCCLHASVPPPPPAAPAAATPPLATAGGPVCPGGLGTPAAAADAAADAGSEAEADAEATTSAAAALHAACRCAARSTS